MALTVLYRVLGSSAWPEYALGRASKSVEALADLAPRTALVRPDGGEPVEVPVEQINVGDVVVVRPNSRIPSDGFVVSGVSAVDQSAVTGPTRESTLATYPQLPAARATFLQRLGRAREATDEFERAATLTDNADTRTLYRRQAHTSAETQADQEGFATVRLRALRLEDAVDPE